MSEITTETCTVEFECTDTSTPFEKRVLTFEDGDEQLVGRTVKENPASLKDTLLFDSRILSRKHAKLFFQKGVLYAVDLNSGHGTFLNGKKVDVDRPQKLQPNGWAVKSGDVVRFASSRKVCASGELHGPIEGRLTVTIQSKAMAKEVETANPVSVMPTYTPFEGHHLEQLAQHPAARHSKSPTTATVKDERKWSQLQPVETCERGTLTSQTETLTVGSQTVPEESDGKQSPYYERWQTTRQEFATYRRQTLKIICICLMIAVLYMQLLGIV